MISTQDLCEVLCLFRRCTHTCSETSYRITDVECIERAKTLQLILTGEIGCPGVRRERQCEENLSVSLQKESNCSDAARSSSINGGISDCENRANEENENKWLNTARWFSGYPRPIAEI